MIKELFYLAITIIFFGLMSCSKKSTQFSKENIEIVNREIVSIDNQQNSLTLSRKKGDGMAILQDIEFDKGVIELELKGENNPGKSFVGLAFNIQNDSTYEAIYFRPFNFQSEKKIRRGHSVQYIFHPKYTWRYLRTNNEGQFESEFPRQPMPDEWFSVKIIIDEVKISVIDPNTGTELLLVTRLTEQVSNKIGLWTGFNSKGDFRNLKIYK